jgi:hypothetical protein
MRKTATIILLAAALGATPAAPATATPTTEPTPTQILQWCGQNSDNCSFLPTGQPVKLTGAKTQLSGRTFNCTSENSDKTLTDTATDTTTDSLGGEISGGISYGIFSAGFKITYKKDWTKTRTVSVARKIVLKPKEVGWFERGAPLQKVTGKFVYRQAKPVEAAHFWFVDTITITGPDPDRTEGDIIERSRPMTDTELKNNCR